MLPDTTAPGLMGSGPGVHGYLRRCDWRFLLPDPDPVSVACLAGGTLRAAVEGTFAGTVATETLLPGTCDLVVAANAGRPVLDDVLALLRPGGCCYVEYGGRMVRAHHVRRRLSDAGFLDVRTYRAWPTVDQVDAWIPMDDGAALSAYLRRDERAAASLRSYVGRWLRRAHASIGRYAGISGCVCAVGVKPGFDGGARLPAALSLPALASRLGDERAARLYVMLETVGRRPTSKVVALAYRAGNVHPVAAIKLARTTTAERGLANEANLLHALQHFTTRPAGIPRLLSSARHMNRLHVAETALEGVPIDVASPAKYADVARSATSWLLELARTTETSPALISEAVASAVGTFAEDYAPVIREDLRRSMEQRLAALSELPCVCEHRDFSPWNVHRAGDGAGLVVFDWESAVGRGVPALDLIYFLSYLAAERRTVPLTADSYRTAWDPSSEVGRVNRRCLSTYVAALRIDPTAIPALRLMTWVLHAASERRRLTEDNGADPPPERLRTALFFTLVELEAMHGTSLRATR